MVAQRPSTKLIVKSNDDCYTDLYDYIKTCNTCSQASNFKPLPPPLTPIPKLKPFQFLHIDYITSYKAGADGHKYLLVLIDGFSKWIELVPTRDMTATTVAEALFKHFCRYGVYEKLVSDLAQNFVSKIVAA